MPQTQSKCTHQKIIALINVTAYNNRRNSQKHTVYQDILIMRNKASGVDSGMKAQLSIKNFIGNSSRFTGREGV